MKPNNFLDNPSKSITFRSSQRLLKTQPILFLTTLTLSYEYKNRKSSMKWRPYEKHTRRAKFLCFTRVQYSQTHWNQKQILSFNAFSIFGSTPPTRIRPRWTLKALIKRQSLSIAWTKRCSRDFCILGYVLLQCPQLPSIKSRTGERNA